jgi:cation:H+ antiporter
MISELFGGVYSALYGLGLSEIVVSVIFFLIGFFLLIKGGDWFVDGAVGLAHRLHLPELLIGATIVSIGTTLPEVMVSSQAAAVGNAGISYGNAIGSVICNTALIAALTAAIRPGKVDRAALKTPVIWFFLSAVVYAGVAYTTGYFSRPVGFVLLALFAAYMVSTVRQMMKNPSAADAEDDGAAKEQPLWKELALLVVGAALIAVGARLLVDNGSLIAKALGVPESVIALTFVALGTSLPALVTAITSLVKGHSALSLGNVIGANLFNLVLVSGLSTTLSPYEVPAGKTIFGVNASLALDIPLCFLVMALLALPALKKEKVMRWQGIVLLVIYAAYIAFQFFF